MLQTYRLSALPCDRRGGVSVLTAFAMTMLIGSAAFAVDIGSLYLDRRQLQGIADAAALAAAAHPGAERAAAERIIAANCDCGIAIAALQPGRYTPDSAVAAEQRFVAGGVSPNAVRIRLTRPSPLYFGGFLTGRSHSVVAVTATGARRGYAAFSLGSRVAALRGGVPNALLSALTGSRVELSLMDYQALASADVDLLAFSEALRTELRADALTFGETLDMQATLPQVLSALARASDGQVADTLEAIADKALPRALIPSRAIDLGPRATSIRADAADRVGVNLMSLMQAMLALGNANRQLELALASDLPGGSAIDVALLIGEPPAQSPLIAVTDDQDVVVRTAQVRLKIVSRIVTPLLTSVELPIVAELGSAAARISDMDCGGSDQRVTLAVTTSPATFAIGTVSDGDFANMQRPLAPQMARVLRLPLASVDARAQLTLADQSEKSLAFSRAEIAAGAVKTVESSGLAGGVARSLARDMDLRVNLLGLGLNAGALASLVGETVGAAAPTLDGVIEGLTGMLGLHLGEADARVNALRCGRTRLV